MLRHRLILGLLFAALFVALIYLDSLCSASWPAQSLSTPPGAFVVLLCILLIPLAVREMQTLLAPSNVHISMRITVAASLLCMLWPWLEQVAQTILDKSHILASATLPALVDQFHALESSPWFHFANARFTRSVKPHYLVPTILALSLVAAVAVHSRRQKVHGAMANAGGTLLAIVYLGVLPGFFLPICLTHSAWMLLAIVAIVKAADIGAYTTGHLLGRHKLIPWLSPGKTVEGFIGGLLFSGLAAVLAAAFSHRYPWPPALLAGLLLGTVGQLGDLLESLLKRDAGVKDSGHIPGFGGLLDLLDSPLLAAPVAYWLLKLL